MPPFLTGSGAAVAAIPTSTTGSTEKERVAGVESVRPSAATARTEKVWLLAGARFP